MARPAPSSAAPRVSKRRRRPWSSGPCGTATRTTTNAETTNAAANQNAQRKSNVEAMIPVSGYPMPMPVATVTDSAAIPGPHLVGRCVPAGQRDRHRRDRVGQALQGPADEDHGERLRGRGQHGADEDDRERDQQDPLLVRSVGQPPEDRRRHRPDQQVHGQGPLRGADRDAELGGQRGHQQEAQRADDRGGEGRVDEGGDEPPARHRGGQPTQHVDRRRPGPRGRRRRAWRPPRPARCSSRAGPRRRAARPAGGDLDDHATTVGGVGAPA